MNIAFFSEMAQIEGSAFHMLRQARWMVENGHRAVMLSSGGALETEFARIGVPHVTIPSVKQGAALEAEQLIADGAAVQRACAEYAVDAVVTAPALPFSLACAAVGARLPVYLTILSNRYFVPATPRTQSEVLRAAVDGRIVATTYGDALAHAEKFGFDPRSVRLAPLPIDCSAVATTEDRRKTRIALGVADDEMLVLTVVRLDPDKCAYVHHLATAVAQMRAARMKVRFVVAGDGTMGDTLRAACPEGTTYLGTRRDLPNLYNACDVYAGEGTTILEAALAQRPVILTSGLNVPERASQAFSVFGVFALEHVLWRTTAINPPTSFLETLALLAQDGSLRQKLAGAAYDNVTANFSIGRFMNWLLAAIRGENPPSLLPMERADTVLHIKGGMSDDVDSAAQLLLDHGSQQQFGLVAETPIPWTRTLAMPLENARALAHAAYREAEPNATARAVPFDLDELPYTSTAPALAFSSPRANVYLALASDAATAIGDLLPLDRITAADGIVYWSPQNGGDPDIAATSARLREETRAEILYIDRPIAWTFVGRIFAILTSYADDGSEEFERYRRLASHLKIPQVTKELL